MMCKGSKSEARNPKYETISNDQNSNDPDKIGAVDITSLILFLSLEFLIFEFVSKFDIRISNFA